MKKSSFSSLALAAVFAGSLAFPANAQSQESSNLDAAPQLQGEFPSERPASIPGAPSEGTYFPDYMPIQTLEYLPGVPVLILLTQPQDHVTMELDYKDAVHHAFGLVGVVRVQKCNFTSCENYKIILSVEQIQKCCSRHLILHTVTFD